MRRPERVVAALACLALCLVAGQAQALKSDRQKPLDVNADSSDGTLGDGVATLRGNVEIRQGTLQISADVASVQKSEGRVQRIELNGEPVRLRQEIEQEGIVTAEARNMAYEVATGIVTLTGAADVVHPQYHISGEILVYDMNLQHFQGSGDEESGRIRIRLDPELIQGEDGGEAPPPAAQPGTPPEEVPEADGGGTG
jgi:lipopolysaccharide export system protein LptA